MSMHFFTQTLEDVRKLIGKGDLKSLKKADQILFNHSNLIGKDLRDEKAAFVALIKASEEHMKILKKLYEDMSKLIAKGQSLDFDDGSTQQNFLYWLGNAEKEARNAVKYAKNLVKYCEEEEIHLQ